MGVPVIHGVHAPNVPLGQFQRDPASPGDRAGFWWRIGVAQAEWVKFLAPDHTPEDVAFARARGLRTIVRLPGEGEVHWEDVNAAIDRYGPVATVLELGNEPADPWVNAAYLEAVADHCLAAAHARRVLLATPGWRMGFHPRAADLVERVVAVYSRFDLIGVHVYDPFWLVWPADKTHPDMLVPAASDHLAAWHSLFPDKRLVLTEYGIASPLDEREKARRYTQFLRLLERDHDYIRAACCFIAGGTPEFGQAPMAYHMSDLGWQAFGRLAAA